MTDAVNGLGWGPAVELAQEAMAQQFAYMMSDPGPFLDDLDGECRDLATRALLALLGYGDDDPNVGWLVWNGEIHRLVEIEYRDGDERTGYTLRVTTEGMDDLPPVPDPAHQRMIDVVRAALVRENAIGDPDDLDRIAAGVVDGLLTTGAPDPDSGWLIRGGEAHDLIDVDAHGADDGYAAWTLSTLAKEG